MLDSSFSLWNHVQLAQASLYVTLTKSSRSAYADSFEHIITGSRRPKRPNEGIGGIIADEMGLGKTLTMLSAIVQHRKLQLSNRLTQDIKTDTLMKSTKKITFASLVIVPNVCKLY
jgi:SWI/SNF-related matrix-associated actin-dependent regulator of chromatin subfamily A3